MIPWILVSIGLVLVILAILAIVVMKSTNKKHRKMDYQTWFIIGIVWLGAGIPLKNYGLSAMGLVFMIVGLVNKDKWKENRVHWSDLDEKEKKVRLWVIGGLGLLLLLGVVFLLLARP